jgi:hypothetical protein
LERKARGVPELVDEPSSALDALDREAEILPDGTPEQQRQSDRIAPVFLNRIERIDDIAD